MDPQDEVAPGAPVVATPAEQLALLVDSVREYAIYLLDPDGRIRTWNAGAARIKGYEAAEVIGRHFALFFPEEDRIAGKPARLLAEAAHAGQVRDDGWRVRRDGTRYWVSAAITAVRGPDGTLRGFAKVSRDETERHAMEERIRHHAEELEREVAERTGALVAQAESLRRANHELEQFNYIASHDLQEPIRMVGLFMQRLAAQAAGKLDADERRWVDYAIEGAERMRRLIEDLLRYTAIEREPTADVATDSRLALDDARARCAEAIAASGARFEVGPLPMVRVDRGQLALVFEHLIRNAITYAVPGEPPRIAISAEPDGDVWRIAVRDHGIGIDPAYHERVFHVFQRLHGRDRYPGTGMGLAISRKIVERHGGRIWVDSAPDAGATFHLVLPRG